MPYEKIVQSIKPSVDPLSDFVSVIDIIEFELGIGTGGATVSERLNGVLADVRRHGSLGEANVETIVDLIERLRKVEAYLIDFWTNDRPSGRTQA